MDLIKSMNNSYKEKKLDEERLLKSFEMWWPNFDSAVKSIESEIKSEDEPNSKTNAKPTDRDLLEVIYSKVLKQDNILQNNIKKPFFREPRISYGAIKDLEEVIELINQIEKDLGLLNLDFDTLNAINDVRNRVLRVNKHISKFVMYKDENIGTLNESK
ncbi:hypothetical protein [Shouchella clausii]|uniref:hypothetical protein n=1 Tax=Shouchella clausii TaxID=79880 RepID=UPI00079B80BD|nr:hypothetical protein [Shouchella clausii]KKI84484.1 hypothetical protein WZ76_20585 [Shouchella clausii]